MARIIAEFSQGVELELRKIKETMEEQTRATDSYFEGMMKQAQHLKANLQDTLETLSDDVMVSLPSFPRNMLLIKITGCYFLSEVRSRRDGRLPSSAQKSQGHFPSDQCGDGCRTRACSGCYDKCRHFQLEEYK